LLDDLSIGAVAGGADVVSPISTDYD